MVSCGVPRQKEAFNVRNLSEIKGIGKKMKEKNINMKVLFLAQKFELPLGDADLSTDTSA